MTEKKFTIYTACSKKQYNRVMIPNNCNRIYKITAATIKKYNNNYVSLTSTPKK